MDGARLVTVVLTLGILWNVKQLVTARPGFNIVDEVSLVDGRGDTTTWADPGVVASLKEQYEDKEG